MVYLFLPFPVVRGVSEVSGLEGESLFQVGTRRQGTWADSETERILKTLISFAKGYGGKPEEFIPI